MNSLSAVLLALASLLLAPAAASHADKRPVGLRGIDFDAAKSAARVERKPMMLLFCDGEAECARIAADMLKEVKLRSWFDDTVVAIQVDTAAQPDLARRYRIRISPTYLFADAKGTEIDRLVGLRESKELRQQGDEILKGGDAFERLQKRRKGHEDDPEMRLRHADFLCDRGELDAALAEYLAVLVQGGPLSDAAFDELMRLQQIYPKAADAIAKLAGAMEPPIRSGAATDEQFRSWFALCQKLKAEQRMLRVYDDLAPQAAFDEEGNPIPVDAQQEARKAELRKRIAPALRDLFYTDRRYSDYASTVADALESLKDRKRQYEEVAATGDAGATKHRLNVLREDSARDYEALIAVRRFGEGTLLADALIGFDTTVETYNALVEGALRAELPQEARLLALRGRSDTRIDPRLRGGIAPSIPAGAK